MNNPTPQEPTAQEEYKVTFINRAPDDKEWTAGIHLLNEWTTPDRYLRHIIQYARSGKHYPADMHVDLILQWHEAEATRREREARIDELKRIEWSGTSSPLVWTTGNDPDMAMLISERIAELKAGDK